MGLLDRQEMPIDAIVGAMATRGELKSLVCTREGTVGIIAALIENRSSPTIKYEMYWDRSHIVKGADT
jgi:hypothetical protein